MTYVQAPTIQQAPERSGAGHGHTALLRKLTHDLADATAVASGALDELRRELLDRPSPMLDILDRSVRRLERIARRMRLSALIDEDGLRIDPATVSLDVLVDRAVASASELDPRKRVPITRVNAAGARIDVVVDEGLAVAAIAEHLSNAVRFARHRVRVVESDDDTHGIVEICDDGPGFAPEYTAAVQKRRWGQLSPKSALALRLSLELVERLGGHTEIGAGLGSEPSSRGACVRVFLPRQDAAR